MSCGTPVVSTDVGGVGEVVTHGETGFLTAPDDLEGFAGRLAELLFDGERARAMGVRAREDALERFRRDKVVGAYEQLYRRVLERRK
jgi:glycosyltransferase involved in cell wall biosynthesis